MGKRFTDTEKWKDEWFLELDNENKLIWIYLLDNCTNAGRWKKSFKHLNFSCNSTITNEKLLKVFDGRVVDKGTYLFIPKFLSFQYPVGLNSEKKAIVAVVKELAQYRLLETVFKVLGEAFLSITHQSPIDKVSIQETEKETEKDNKGVLGGKRYDPKVSALIHKTAEKIKKRGLKSL